MKNLTADIPVNFWNEKHDTPSHPGPYGIASWVENDEYVLINDAFDIWKIDPKGEKKAENITLHAGRTDSITFRYLNTDPEKRFIEPEDLLLLTASTTRARSRASTRWHRKDVNPSGKECWRDSPSPRYPKQR